MDRTMGFVQTDDQFNAWGTLASPTIQASMDCTLTVAGGACNPAAGNGRTGTLAQWQANNTVSFTFSSPANSGITSDYLVHAETGVTYQVTAGTFDLSYTVPVPVPFRFDSATSYTGRPGGAVFNDAVPTLTFNAADPGITQSANHIQTALNNPAATWPQVTPKPIPGGGRNLNDFLTRTTDAARINSNRGAADTACAQAVNFGFFPAPTAGQQCDEFPFATTYEGASAGNLLYSVRYISGADNQESGNRINGFYRANRMIDGDEFAVGVYSTAPAVVDVAGGGAFATVWAAAGGAGGALGVPIGNWYAIPGGQEQQFANGAIYWSAATGTHEVQGVIYADYADLGGPASQLGFPVSNEQNAPGGGRESLFAGTSCGSAAGSAILWTPASGAGELQGCIYQAYLNTYGGSAGSLGYPTSNEQGIAAGRVNYFTGGPAKPSCSTGSEPADGISTAAIYWDGVAHDVTGCIFAEYHAVGEAAGELGFPTDDAYAYNGGHQQNFQNGYIFDINGTATVTLGGNWVVGHAAHAGNDYPYETVGQFEHQDEGADAWNEYYGQCDSFGAWKVYENLAGSAAQHPNTPVPAVGWQPSNASISPVNQNTWYNADNWDVMWKAQGVAVNNVPAPGTIAYWPNATADPQDHHPTSANGIGEFGHVGYVTDVYPDGSVTIEMYNLRINGEYSVIHMAYGKSAVDTSYNQGSYTVPWPTSFIHVGDGTGSSTPASPEPANGTVSWGYPSQVKVIGPGSPSSEYSLATSTWYLDSGHGELGSEEWTHTNGAAADSTATYTPSGLSASTCYEVDAFVPNNYSDNPVAVYTVSDAKGTYLAAVNENQYTNDWAELGVYETSGSGGGLAVKLDDRGTTGLYVAADAMRFWKQASCSGYGDVSPIIGPGTLPGSWSTDSGHGFFGNEKYSPTHGTVLQNYATYNPHLLVEDCYEVFAYVPDNYSDNNAATYEILDQWHGDFWPQVNENSFTSQFTDLGAFMSRGDGTLPVTLEDLGPSGEYVAADAVAYTLDANCSGVGESGTGLGNVYQPNQIGPGSPPSLFSTANPWFTRLGHGYTQHELWTYDNGSTADSTATWTFHGNASTCYAVSAYIPDNFADNPQAHYSVGTSLEGFGSAYDQEAYTNAFMSLGAVTTGSDGVITVSLSDVGPITDSSGSRLYTAADAMQFDEGGAGC
ncbi:MAG: CHAP domain-containing protein [Streptosporangiaceae bacterium]|nr:CHAP domain-containing protein [Streptosporangiaceae bacterium]